MDTAKMVRAYVKIRDRRAELKKAYEEEDNDLKAKLTKIETEMLRFCIDNGIDSVKTDHGTFYRQETVLPSVGDWEAVYAFIRAEDAFEMLERRVTRSFITQYMEDHQGALPPGVSVHRKYEVRVRR